MGSPLGPLFANIFMCEFEKKHMKELRKIGVKRWLRYVDDIFATFNCKEEAEKALEYLNRQHPNLKFTIEHERNNQLPFLDTSVRRNSYQYFTTLYRKPTFTGVYLNWTSLTSKKYKIGLIRCLMDRIWKICSLESDRKSEVETLKIILIRNDYPLEIINQEIARYLQSKATPQQTKEKAPEKRYIVLPFVHRRADEFAVRLRNLVCSNYPQVDFNVAFKAPCTIADLFPFKEHLKKCRKSCIS